MDISVKTFEELTLQELHDILQLRSEVFVVEQDCVYQDIDGKDGKALHVFGTKNGQIVSYARCFPPGAYFEYAAIGRVVVPMKERKFGYGHDIMKASIDAVQQRFKSTKMKVSAQTHLRKFYESHGFQKIGEDYLEDGIPHIAMLRE